MKHSISYRHRFRTQISILFCLAELLPLSAQEQKEDKEIRLNMDAVKMIQFDFNGNSPERKETPKEAPVEKSWMKFKEFTSIPRSLTDSSILWKPTGWFRFEPYTIWTKFGEDPIYDKLVAGRPKKLEFSWTLNPYAPYYDEYGLSIAPSTGAMYRRATGGAGGPLGASAVIGGLDFIAFLYSTLSPRGRMLAHNKKHANAWKTYKDYKPTKEDSLKMPNFYRLLPVYSTKDTDSIAQAVPADTLKMPARPDGNKKQKEKKPSPQSSEGNLYEYIRRKQTEDSISHQKKKRGKEMHTNPYDVQRQIRRLREMSD